MFSLFSLTDQTYLYFKSGNFRVTVKKEAAKLRWTRIVCLVLRCLGGCEFTEQQ